MATAADDAEREASEALFDDLNAPLALGALFTFIRKANAELDRGGDDKASLERARSAFTAINGVLDVVPALQTGDNSAQIEERLAERRAARDRRDFVTADSIRKELEKEGIAIEDGPSGTRWKRVR